MFSDNFLLNPYEFLGLSLPLSLMGPFSFWYTLKLEQKINPLDPKILLASIKFLVP